MAVRIEDVAKAAGVSMKTVSRVLNNEPSVRDATRMRVQDAAKAMNYRPDRSARSLAGNRSYQVALLYDNPSASYLMEIMVGVVEACQEQHYGMLLQPLDYRSPTLVDDVADIVVHARVDGLILTPPISDSVDVLDRLDALGIRYACVSPSKRESAIGVGIDEYEASCEMMAHLVELGHRRIAHIRGNPAQGATEWRFDGYCSGLARAGLTYEAELVIQGSFTFESGLAAMDILLAMPHPPTAIFAANDDMAAGVMRIAHERGLTIPDDISVCGFDNSSVSRQIFPALTTVHQPTRAMGHVATSELLRSINSRHDGKMVHLPHALVLRQSTGPAPVR